MTRLLVFFIGCLIIQATFAQQNEKAYPKPGDKLSHQFTDLLNSSEKNIRIDRRNGKWLILDFWAQGCTSCIASIPKMNKLYKIFKDKADFLMVGLYGISKREAMIKIYMNLVKRHSLTMPSALDSSVQAKFDIGTVPTIFVINPKGQIVAKAVSLDSSILAKLILGEKADYEPSYSAHEQVKSPSYNISQPLLNFENNSIITDTALLYRSIITTWSKDKAGTLYGFDHSDLKKMRWLAGLKP
jgi:thiol-disulfide isomerase/thioredoxin